MSDEFTPPGTPGTGSNSGGPNGPAGQTPPTAPRPIGSPHDPLLRPQLSLPEMESGKTMAILSYVLLLVGIPLCILPLFTKENPFSLYHAKQAMMIWLASLAGFVAALVLTPLACFCGPVFPVLALGIGLSLLVLTIFGIIAAVKPAVQPLPVIGEWAERLFRGVQMQPRPPA